MKPRRAWFMARRESRWQQDRTVAERRRNIVDLHCHTSATDSGMGLPPSAVSFFRRNRYRAISITEHANLDSLDAAREAAREVGIEYISGIEIAVRCDNPPPGQRTAHLLGYHVEAGAKLTALCERVREKTEDALEELLARLFAAGVADISEEELREELKARCGEYDEWKRPLSSAMVEAVLRRQGILSGAPWASLDDLFTAYCPDIRDSWLPTADEALEALREAGATVMLAHPLRGAEEGEEEKTRQMLEWWLSGCVDGLEVYYPECGTAQRRMLLELVRHRGRPYSGGSNTHEFDSAERIRVSDAPYACVQSIMEFRSGGKVLTYPDHDAEGRR